MKKISRIKPTSPIHDADDDAILLHALAQSDEPLAVALIGKLGAQIAALATIASTNENPEVRAFGRLLDGLETEADVMRELLRRGHT